jgi:DNA-binding transcriptional regulator YiaG
MATTSGPSLPPGINTLESTSNDDWKVVGRGGKPKGLGKSNKSNGHDQTTSSYSATTTTQDLNTITFNKSNKITVQMNKLSKNNSTPNSSSHFDSSKARKVEELHESGDFSLEKCSKKLSNSIISGRTSLKLTQEEFAKLCNISVGIIRSYERGTMVPTGAHLNIMSNKLGVTLSK